MLPRRLRATKFSQRFSLENAPDEILINFSFTQLNNFSSSDFIMCLSLFLFVVLSIRENHFWSFLVILRKAELFETVDGCTPWARFNFT